jgi:hypothetical protein
VFYISSTYSDFIENEKSGGEIKELIYEFKRVYHALHKEDNSEWVRLQKR